MPRRRWLTVPRFELAGVWRAFASRAGATRAKQSALVAVVGAAGRGRLGAAGERWGMVEGARPGRQ